MVADGNKSTFQQMLWAGRSGIWTIYLHSHLAVCLDYNPINMKKIHFVDPYVHLQRADFFKHFLEQKRASDFSIHGGEIFRKLYDCCTS